ncbi:MAG: T9SS type A sorting domain-containing protein [Tannerella sp.]|nr:T9SS type A sorting domain-containing protein [Tannerella sp.]
MKKMKFTLGLALSMLFLGASVSHAAIMYDNSKPNNGAIPVSIYVNKCEFYAGEGVTLHKVAADPTGYYQYNVNYPDLRSGWQFPANSLHDNDAAWTISNFWSYGNPLSASAYDYLINEAPGSAGYLNYYVPGIPTGTTAGLFYYNVKSGTSAYNRIQVQLGYVNGNELMPVIKRTITVGKFTYNASQGRNNLSSENIELYDFLVADSSWFRPDMDRKSGIATYIYNDQMLPLLDKEIIYSIKYEVSIHDEVGSPGENEYQPPVNSDVTIMRGVTIIAENGILTVPRSESDTIIAYTPSHKDFTFKVYSSKDIEVTTNRGRDDEGVKITDNGDGSFDVTIRRVQSNIKVTVKSASTESGTGEGGTTGNTAPSDDAVWAANGTLYVQTANPATISVYSVTGQLHKQAFVNGSYSVAMSKGIYIVQLNGKTYKVVL